MSEERAGRATKLDTGQVRAFVEEVLLRADRTIPVVGVTVRRGDTDPMVDADALAEDLGDAARVVVLATGDPTWELTDALADELDVYGGATRIWWPGLTRESDPQEHPLLFCWNRGEAPRVFERVVRLVTGSAPARSRTRMATAPNTLNATIESLAGELPVVRTGDLRGPLVEADLPMPDFCATLSVGMELPVRILFREKDGTVQFSAAGTYSSWQRVEQEYRVGDVVHGRVAELERNRVLVDLLPGARGVVPMSELDWAYVQHASEIVAEGDWVTAEIRKLIPAERECVLSIKRGRMAAPRDPISLVDGGPPFGPPVDDDDRAERPLRDRIEQLEQEVVALRGERKSLLERLRETRERLVDARRAPSPAETEEAGTDPFRDERTFLRAVRVAYATSMGEADRREFPLERMRVGREFLERARSLDGVGAEKIVEVCMQVACQRAHQIPARRVHRLRDGPAGSPNRMRPADGAAAWRCSLQDNSPAARRLHWWDVPGESGRTIEFASVATHDDMSIPE